MIRDVQDYCWVATLGSGMQDELDCLSGSIDARIYNFRDRRSVLKGSRTAPSRFGLFLIIKIGETNHNVMAFNPRCRKSCHWLLVHIFGWCEVLKFLRCGYLIENIAEIIKAVVNDQTSSFLEKVVFAVDGTVTSGAKKV